MRISTSLKTLFAAVATIVALSAPVLVPENVAAQTAVKVPQIPAGKENDAKFYAANGDNGKGHAARDEMPTHDLVRGLGGKRWWALCGVRGREGKGEPAGGRGGGGTAGS